jgi:hypothetical protein
MPGIRPVVNGWPRRSLTNERKDEGIDYVSETDGRDYHTDERRAVSANPHNSASKKTAAERERIKEILK